MDLPVRVSEAVLGASIEVPTPDGAVRVMLSRSLGKLQEMLAEE